jgi:3-deoxy-D-manno-octulosonic-acid transferase
LISIKAGFSINTVDELVQTADRLMNNADYRAETGAKIKQYVREHIGATDTIVKYITDVK